MTPIPAPLLAVVNAAGDAYGVPYGLLLGMWVIESGANYPNVAVNSLGYGGLFGTKLWNAAPQDQANLAASTLADLYGRFGSWDAALHEYSSGTTMSGYGLDRVDSALGTLDLLLTPDEHNWLQEAAIRSQMIIAALGITYVQDHPELSISQKIVDLEAQLAKIEGLLAATPVLPVAEPKTVNLTITGTATGSLT